MSHPDFPAMKNPIRLYALTAAILAIAFSLVLLCAPTTAFAQAPNPAPVAAASTPFYASGEFWTTVFAIVAGIFGIWKNSQHSTAQKINESLVLGIEKATKIPRVADYERQIKQTIQAKATEYGVQPLLHRLVQDLTEPAAQPDAGGES